MFQLRCQQIRTLKTRAKLRAIFRRRGKFEWDINMKPFFTSKHVRWASQCKWDAISGHARRYEYDPISNRMVPARPAGLVHLPNDEVDLLTADRVRASMGKSKNADTTTATATATSTASTPQEKATMETEFDKRAATEDFETAAILAQRGQANAQLNHKLARWETSDTVQKAKEAKEDLHSEQSLKQSLMDLERQMGELMDKNARATGAWEKIRLQDDLIVVKDQVAKAKIEWQNLGLSSQNPNEIHSVSKSSINRLQTSLDRSKAARPSTGKSVSSFEDADDSAAHESTELVPSSSALGVPKEWSKQVDLLQADRVKRLTSKRPFPLLPRWIDDMNARKAAYEVGKKDNPGELLNEQVKSQDKLAKQLENEVKDFKLRMHAHEGRFKHMLEEPRNKLGNNDGKLESELQRFDRAAAGKRTAEQLDSELKAQKAQAMNEVETREARYKGKISALKAELDTAYKQSSEHSEMHVDHIRKLETALKQYESQPKRKNSEHSIANRPQTHDAELQRQLSLHDKRYKEKLHTLQSELDTVHKQSSKHSEMHMEQIRKLEKELQKFKTTSSTETKAQHIDNHPHKVMQGEGDFCPNITKYADSTKWYKQPVIIAASRQTQEKEEQKARDAKLVKEVREIYEGAYGTIDAYHRQNMFSRALARDSKPAKQIAKADPDVDLGDALAAHEKEQQYAFGDNGLAGDLKKQRNMPVQDSSLQYRFKADGLANEIAQQEKEAHEAVAVSERAKNAIVPKASGVKVEANTSANTEPVLEWADPPLYKVLAYDSGNDRLSIATTTANFTPSESPISIPQALSQLYQPARFVPHFAEMQQDGFQLIYATRDLIVLKKVKPAPESAVLELQPQRTEHLNIADHGLLRPKENSMAQEAAMYHDNFKPESSSGAIPVENSAGIRPPENAMAQEAAEAYDLKRNSFRNPIDGMTQVRPATGNYASPTGFVNHDPVLTKEEEEHIEYPRVKRQEPVFSATLPPPPVPSFGGRGAEKRERRRLEREEMMQWRRERYQRQSRSGGVKWVLGVGGVAAGTAYIIGTAAERIRKEKEGAAEKGKDRWQQILEGKRGRFE